jgi:hypothetical protein
MPTACRLVSGRVSSLVGAGTQVEDRGASTAGLGGDVTVFACGPASSGMRSGPPWPMVSGEVVYGGDGVLTVGDLSTSSVEAGRAWV